jgi:ABC-type multidrug transport system ATPase subunit
MSVIIRVSELSKSFHEIGAVDQLSFTVQKNAVYGFLGQNGAGKSTTIRMLLTLVKPDAGDVEIFGMNLQKHRSEILKRTGAMIEKPDLYKYLTAYENLRLFAMLSGIRLSKTHLMDQLHLVGLAARAHSKVSTFSQGMKQRLGIAIALVHDPDLILLDEPMNGLDPQGMADIRQLILQLQRERGKTIFISSHLLSEMEQVADYLLIIHKGKKVVEGKTADLLNPEFCDVEIQTTAAEELISRLQSTPWNHNIKQLQRSGMVIQIRKAEIPDLIKAIGQMALPVYAIRPKNSLEDYFLSHTNN